MNRSILIDIQGLVVDEDWRELHKLADALNDAFAHVKVGLLHTETGDYLLLTDYDAEREPAAELNVRSTEHAFDARRRARETLDGRRAALEALDANALDAGARDALHHWFMSHEGHDNWSGLTIEGIEQYVAEIRKMEPDKIEMTNLEIAVAINEVHIPF